MKLRLDPQNYDECPAYNEWLDERYSEEWEPLKDSGFPDRPSLVLFSLCQTNYEAAFADFQAERQEELERMICEEFPSPIAHYFYRFLNGYENDLQRLHFLRDTWEAIVDVLHAIAVAECRFRQIALAAPIRCNELLSNSVAQRIENIESMVAQAKAIGVTLAVSKIANATTLQTMRELNQSRNGFSHSAAQSEAQARVWISECYEDVIDVLDDLRDLADVQIMRYTGQVDATTLRCETFRGHGFTKTIKQIPLTADQVRDSARYFQQDQLLVVCDSVVLSVRPLMCFQDNATGHTTRLCMFRQTHGDPPNRLLEFEVVGEAKRHDVDRTLFKAELDEIRSLFGLGTD